MRQKLGNDRLIALLVYSNEQEIGKAFQVILDGGVPREELFITSKVWNDMHGEGEVIASCKQTLSDLGLDYLDMYLVHWPFPNYHPIVIRLNHEVQIQSHTSMQII